MRHKTSCAKKPVARSDGIQSSDLRLPEPLLKVLKLEPDSPFARHHASWELMASELSLLRNPQVDLVCDVNPLVSCGASLNVWQGNLLGVPNSFIGAMAFAVLLAVGALLASGGRLPRWIGGGSWREALAVSPSSPLLQLCKVKPESRPRKNSGPIARGWMIS